MEIEKFSSKSEKSIGILSTILSNDDPLKDSLLHYFKVLQRISCAETLLANLQSQVGTLCSESLNHVQTLDLIEKASC